jgi:hypothetical protein
MTVSGSVDGGGNTTITVAGSAGALGALLHTNEGTWGISGNGTITFITGVGGHPGIVRLTTSSGSGVRIHAGHAIGDCIMLPNELVRWDWYVRINNTSNVQVNVGLSNTSLVSANQFIIIQFASASSAHLFGFCGDNIAGSPSSVDFGVAPGTGFIKLSAILNGGNIDFALNDVVKGTVSTHVPTTTALNWFIEIFSSSGSVSVDVDKSRLEGNPSR